MTTHTIIQISESVKHDIIKNIIEPGYIDDIKRNMFLKKRYANAGLLFESLSKIFIGISSITSFSAGIYQYQLLAFLAGAGSVASLIFLQFSSYSFRESKVISDGLNKILKKLHIDTLPDGIGSSETTDISTHPLPNPTNTEPETILHQGTTI